MMSVMHQRFFGNTFDIYECTLYNYSVEENKLQLNIVDINLMLAEIADEEQQAYMDYMIDCFLEEQQYITQSNEELQKQYEMMAAEADAEYFGMA